MHVILIGDKKRYLHQSGKLQYVRRLYESR